MNHLKYQIDIYEFLLRHIYTNLILINSIFMPVEVSNTFKVALVLGLAISGMFNTICIDYL